MNEPCPFCGSTNLIETWNSDDERTIMCCVCNALGPTIADACYVTVTGIPNATRSFDEAWKKWNERI